MGSGRTGGGDPRDSVAVDVTGWEDREVWEGRLLCLTSGLLEARMSVMRKEDFLDDVIDFFTISTGWAWSSW